MTTLIFVKVRTYLILIVDYPHVNGQPVSDDNLFDNFCKERKLDDQEKSILRALLNAQKEGYTANVIRINYEGHTDKVETVVTDGTVLAAQNLEPSVWFSKGEIKQ